MIGAGSGRLVAIYGHGTLELVWFQGANWILEKAKRYEYVVWQIYLDEKSHTHPELELLTERNDAIFFSYVYPLSENASHKQVDSELISKLQQTYSDCHAASSETLPDSLRQKFRLIGKVDALQQIHLRIHAWAIDSGSAATEVWRVVLYPTSVIET